MRSSRHVPHVNMFGLGTRFVAASFAIALVSLLAWMSTDRGAPPDFEADCEQGEPWLVTTCFRGQTAKGSRPRPEGASIVLFKDTPDDEPHYALSNIEQTGSVWGLAYSARERAIYAGAYHKRAVPHGPEGPGAVYRIDLVSGDVRHVFDVPDAGTDRHRMGAVVTGRVDFDDLAAEWVGKTSLGDIEITPDGTRLFVMNLADRRIHRYSLPEGDWLGSFEHGARDERWAHNARPFGLGWHEEEDRLLHGVLNEQGNASAFVAVVYSSATDGSDLREDGRFRLDYRRERVRLRCCGPHFVDWERWDDLVRPRSPIGARAASGLIPVGFPMPMLTDLEVTGDGDLIIALRDRSWDALPAYIRDTIRLSPDPFITIKEGEQGLGFGDLILGRRSETGWVFEEGFDEHLDEENSIRHGESAQGGLTWIASDRRLVSTAFGIGPDRAERGWGTEGTYWYDTTSGNKVSGETVCAPGSLTPYSDLLSRSRTAHADSEGTFVIQRDLGSLGDIETVCSLEAPTATPTDTPTSTATPTPSNTPTTDPSATPTPTPTATPIPQPIYLPISLTERCDPTLVRADVALVLDASSSMDGPKLAAAKAAAVAFIGALHLPEDRVGIAAFNREARLVHPLSGDRTSLESAIRAIEMSPGTRIDRGLAAGIEVLAGARTGPEFTPVLVLLTDGIQEAEPDAPGLAADRIRAADVVLHVVGLGADVDAEFLRDLAGTADGLHLSPGPAELEAIYTEIARSIPCPVEAFWGRR